MKLINTRSLIAALGLSLVAHGAWAQAPALPSVQNTTAAPASLPVAAAPHGPHGSHGPHTDASKHHQDIVAKLDLSAAQKIQFDAAQTARKDLRQAKQTAMLARKKMMAEQLNKEQMDPRAAMELSKQSQPAIQAKRTVAEQKWLAFWDGLTAEQRKTFTAEMKTRHDKMAQHSHKGPHS